MTMLTSAAVRNPSAYASLRTELLRGIAEACRHLLTHAAEAAGERTVPHSAAR